MYSDICNKKLNLNNHGITPEQMQNITSPQAIQKSRDLSHGKKSPKIYVGKTTGLMGNSRSRRV